VILFQKKLKYLLNNLNPSVDKKLSRLAHNQEIVGANPTTGTTFKNLFRSLTWDAFKEPGTKGGKHPKKLDTFRYKEEW
jgi:hypothetical protein